MNINETTKDLNPEIKKKLGKSNLEVLTNENDFLVKHLKKAGWFFWAKKFFKVRNNDLLNYHPNIFNLSNIKFLLNIQINTPNNNHIKKILVILSKSL